jgi:hypothetical protein
VYNYLNVPIDLKNYLLHNGMFKEIGTNVIQLHKIGKQMIGSLFCNRQQENDTPKGNISKRTFSQ